jgi:tRNA G10  N-methylase Trm11
VPQEALLMGFKNVRASDHSAKAISDTKENLAWMKLPAIPLTVERAEDLGTSGTMQKGSVDRIVFEGYLGKPSPQPQLLAAMQPELMKLYTESFKSFDVILADDGVIVAALPFWSFGTITKHLDIDRIVGSKFSIVRGPLLYKRPQSTVGREIIVVKRRT